MTNIILQPLPEFLIIAKITPKNASSYWPRKNVCIHYNLPTSKKHPLQNPDTVARKSLGIPRALRSKTLVLSFGPWLDDDANY